jgi:predicted ATPase
MIGQTINDRYQITDQIGAGGMGVVYRANDLLLQREVALKMISEERLGPLDRLNLLREAQLAAGLDHPNIVTIYDAGELGENPYIVMQLLEGHTLRSYSPESFQELIDIAKQVCLALESAHQHQIIHRDLKPENIFRNASNQIRLMDFGLARSAASRMTSEGALVGTVFYMAPEQIRGEAPDARTDLYALGVLLYELSTGKLPFYDENAVAVLTQHLHSPPIPPHGRKDNIPQGLNNLILDLLEKEPADRPRSARAVMLRLEGFEETDLEVGSSLPATGLERLARGRMIGRQAELQVARGLWQHTVSGQGKILLISGEAGIGKTRLVQEIMTHARISGGQVYTGESYEEGGLPYDVFSQIIREAVAEDGPRTTERLPTYTLAELLKLIPDLQPRFPEIQLTPKLEPAAEHGRLLESIITFCKILSQHQPLLLVIDDIHWADSATLSLFRNLARRIRQMPVMIVTAYRESELNKKRTFNQVLSELTRTRICTRIKLGRLTKETTLVFLESLLQTRSIPEDLQSQVYLETEGNPLFIEEIVKSLVENDRIYFRDGAWQRDESLNALEIPQSIRITIQVRLGGLDDTTQSILTHAAVIGREFDFQILRQVASESAEAVITALEDGMQAQLIQERRRKSGEHFAFVHALIPVAIRASLSRLRLDRLHHKVGQTLEELRPDGFPALAHHFSEAGDEENALTYTLKAAEQSKQSYANADALDYYSEALSLAEGEALAAFDLLKGRAELHLTIGNHELAVQDIQVLHTLAEGLNDRSLQVEVFILEAVWGQHATDLDKLLAAGRQAVSVARSLSEPALLARALHMLGIGHWYAGDYFNSIEALEQAIAHFRPSQSYKELGASLSFLGLSYRDLRRFEDAIEVTQEALQLNRQEQDRFEEANSLRRLGLIYLYQEDFKQARSYYVQAIAKAHEIGAKFIEIYNISALCLLLWHQGDFQAALASLREGLRIAWEIEEPVSITRFVGRIMMLEFYSQGNFQAGWEFFVDMMAKAAELDLPRVLETSARTEANFRRIVGQYPLALEKYRQVRKEEAERASTSPQGLAMYLTIAYAEQGNFEAAHEEFEPVFQTRHEGAYAMDPEYQSELLEVHTALLLLQGDPSKLPTARELAEQALEISRATQPQPHQNLADRLNLSAQLHLLTGQLDKARVRSQELIDCVRAGGPWLFTEQFYFTHARVLRETGDIEGANAYLLKAYDRVMRVSGHFTDTDLKDAWLSKQIYNRQIIAAAIEFGLAG